MMLFGDGDLQTRRVVIEEQAGDKFTSRADPGLVEDRLEVVLDGVAERRSRCLVGPDSMVVGIK
jgi:hypothetical protein